MTGSTRRRASAVVGAAIGLLLLPAIALAHPLGNFTINHYAGIRVEPDRVLLDVVIDQAEIPAFQARQAFDTDGDGSVGDEEMDAGRVAACTDLAPDLRLTVSGAGVMPRLTNAGLTFPLGTSGLSTMRLVCAFDVSLPTALTPDAPTRIDFTDVSYPDRLGWREIVVVGSGSTVTVVGGSGRTDSPSARLSSYPEDLIAQPLADAAVTLDAVAGGPVLPAFVVADAAPVPGAVPVAASPPPVSSPAISAGPAPAPVAPAASATVAVVPGGITGDLPSIFRAADVTPLVLLLSLAAAAALGAGHALTPGHGKTLMAAYLVGTRGTPLHALGLGLSVSVSHTVGILVLAAVVVGATDILSPDLVVRTAPVIAAVSIVAIGAWMLAGEVRRRRSLAARSREHAEAHAQDLPHDHEDAHDHGHDDGRDPGPDHHDDAAAGEAGEHSHGGTRHSHLPAAGNTITWRSLFVLGLAGGLIPSTSALLILLGSIASGRPAFGLVLVVAFGLGMAAVMAGIGLVMVFARDRVDRLPSGGGLGRVRDVVPLMAAVFVFGFGIYLTAQAIGGTPTF